LKAPWLVYIKQQVIKLKAIWFVPFRQKIFLSDNYVTSNLNTLGTMISQAIFTGLVPMLLVQYIIGTQVSYIA